MGEAARDKRFLLEVTVNGNSFKGLVSKKKSLADFVRDDLHLTGTKKGCSTGDCGSCVILINGKPRTSCNFPAYKADGAEIVTIEGIADGKKLSPVQQAFIECGAIQCGFCTPGMVIEAHALLNENSRPSGAEIKDAISNHICRCTGYVKIVEAISLAAGRTGKKPDINV